MKKIIPLIALDASLKAFAKAKADYNRQADLAYTKDLTTARQTFGSQTALGATLRQVHYALFYQIINEYAERIDRLPASLNEFYPNELLGLWITRGDLAVKLGISPRTVYNLLERLQKAQILNVTKHGSKKPLEIRVKSDVLIVFDKKDSEYVPSSKFLTLSLSDNPLHIGKILPNKKEIRRALNNNTIPESGVSESVSETKQRNVSDIQTSSETASGKVSETVVPSAEPVSRAFLSRAQKTVLDQNEKTQQFNIDGFAERNIARLLEKRKAAGEIAPKPSLKPMGTRFAESRRGHAQMFVGELLFRLFPNQYHSPEYRQKLVEYTEIHYFAKTYDITQVQNRWTNLLQPCIAIAQSWLEKFRTPDGKPFDRTYFFPLAYLDIEKKGKQFLSFVNTLSFIQNSRKYEKLNGYNRRLTKDLQHKINITARKVENGFTDYETARQKILSLCTLSDEPLKQFNARMSGIYTK